MVGIYFWVCSLILDLMSLLGLFISGFDVLVFNFVFYLVKIRSHFILFLKMGPTEDLFCFLDLTSCNFLFLIFLFN